MRKLRIDIEIVDNGWVISVPAPLLPELFGEATVVVESVSHDPKRLLTAIEAVCEARLFKKEKARAPQG